MAFRVDGVSPSYSQWQRSCCCDGRSVGKLGPGRVCGVPHQGRLIWPQWRLISENNKIDKNSSAPQTNNRRCQPPANRQRQRASLETICISLGVYRLKSSTYIPYQYITITLETMYNRNWYKLPWVPYCCMYTRAMPD